MKKISSKSYPLGKRTEPSLDTWKHLFSTVRMFYEPCPWEALRNEDLFSVIDPVSGQTDLPPNAIFRMIGKNKPWKKRFESWHRRNPKAGV
jgi:hypothetical protein